MQQERDVVVLLQYVKWRLSCDSLKSNPAEPENAFLTVNDAGV